jgi:hypothetical protein
VPEPLDRLGYPSAIEVGKNWTGSPFDLGVLVHNREQLPVACCKHACVGCFPDNERLDRDRAVGRERFDPVCDRCSSSLCRVHRHAPDPEEIHSVHNYRSCR